MPMNPLFSIITITFNAEATLPATLASVAQQDFTFYEYIVIDGASKDNTVKLAKESGIPNIKILSEPDRGLYDAMNKGLGMATGDYVIFLNAGDSFHSQRVLSKLAETILDNDYPGIVYGQTDLVDASRKRVAPRHLSAPSVLTLNSFKHGMVVCHQAFVVLRKIADNYNLNYRFSADYDWCIRCLQRSHRNLYVDSVLIDYLYEGLTTKNRRASLLERFDIMCKYYGTFPTVMRHLSFAVRAFKRKLAGRPS